MRVTSLTVVVAAAAFILCAPASANNDPHRIPFPSPPFDLPASYCGFPVHLAATVDREYATVSTSPDGSTVYKITGSIFVTVTNLTTGKSVTVNASGPATETVAPDGTTVTIDGRGLFLLYAANGTQFGLPSDIVLEAGPTNLTVDLATDTIISVASPAPHVLVDLCAALSS
jgi:hypothetical protein